MFARVLVLVSLLAIPVLAQTPPATQPTIKLHAVASASDEVDLHWYDTIGKTPRYLVRRSDDGKNWHTVGYANGGAGTGPLYQVSDTKVTEQTHYTYRLETPEQQILSDTVEVDTPEKNLFEAAEGKSKVGISDITSVGFWRATLDATVEWLESFVPKLLAAALIFFLFYLFHHFTRHIATRSMKRANVDLGVRDLMLSMLKWCILGFALVIACDQIGVHITALLAGISICGLAVGFAAQDTLANLIASVVIFWDKPFRVGDWITFNSIYGQVQRVTFRTTRVLTRDGDLIVAPNVLVQGSMLLNHSTDPVNWVTVPLTVAPTVSIPAARAALLAACKGDDRLAAQPAPRVAVESFDPSAVKLSLSFCIKSESDHLILLQEYTEKSKTALDALK